MTFSRALAQQFVARRRPAASVIPPTPSAAGKFNRLRLALTCSTLIMQVSIQELQELIEQLASETQSIHEPAAQNLVEAGAAAAVPLSQICNTPSRFSHRAAAF
jgi:hypothetical protein